MGQTLSHGVYLPAEGERNCYSGLASNWNLLDTAIGDTAGKASATHTHGNITNDGKVGTTANLPLITGTSGTITTGSFGTSANTFCEGNDSRLSDARTPVAHTHGKADITDLFNSANTWSALNTYSNGQIRIKSQSQEIGVIPSSNVIQYLEFADKNDAQRGIVGLWDYNDGASEIQMYVADKFKNGQKDPTGTKESTFFSFGFKANGSKFLTFSGQLQNSLIPNANNTYDLGSSNYKWKTLNGINPGALSLPNYDDTTYIDISGSIVPPSGQTTINYSGGDNQYTPPVDGWLSIRCDGATFLQIYRNAYNCPGTTASRQDASGKLVVTLPVLKNTTYTIKINTSGTTNVFQLYPCQGNV